MTFTPEQVKELEAPLSTAHVKKNPRGFDYVEAYHAENEANRIFGFDAWDRETELTPISDAVVGDKHRVYYRAKVRITVRTPGGGRVVREGCGYGSGIDKDLGQAHESALKEAESDAEKRALKTFGNPFGQALYDKTKANVTDEPPASAEPSMAVQAARLAIEMCGSPPELAGWLTEHKEMLNKLSDADYAAVGEIIRAKKAEFKLKVAS